MSGVDFGSENIEIHVRDFDGIFRGVGFEGCEIKAKSA